MGSYSNEITVDYEALFVMLLDVFYVFMCIHYMTYTMFMNFSIHNSHVLGLRLTGSYHVML